MYTDSNMKDYGQGTLTQYADAARNVAETNNTLYIDAYSTMGITPYTADQVFGRWCSSNSRRAFLIYQSSR